MLHTYLPRAQCEHPIRNFLFLEVFVTNGMMLGHATPTSPASADSRESDFSLSRMTSRRSFINDVPSDQCTASRPLVRFDHKFRKQKKVVRFEYPMEKVLLFSPESKVSPLPESMPNSFENNKHGSLRRCTLRGGVSSGIQWEMQCPGNVTKRQRYLDAVNLQHVQILSGTIFEGIVSVVNIAFEKRVGAKFTFDNWHTTSEVGCDYVGKACTSQQAGEKDWDLFRFKIGLNNDNIEPFEKILKLSVYYEVDEKEYWDNNYGQNYAIKLYKAEGHGGQKC
ncbi:putative phosphatase regulatory subunit-domain-containing protein [Aspergillus pseudonomiae]|uniref:Putative phosphatase regulatory subunit-domain-containing protein n=1 Tax=Aspergillus pseudonomiae TaxID=1506151 RepID=A0A5N7CT19_9EURO|nr:putative phosphatase regulatory subunit-domain-containing protein [Aspergillus pseudonomiae]KAE8397346.1 putative phosphatase regulatory subunit-domain-containing protein [Aspergillus pseudonomiae]